MSNLDCPDAAGSINNPNSRVSLARYIPPDNCIGTFQISQGECADIENKYQESLAASVLNISGAPVNVYKLLGNHEQGKLIDLIGHGITLGSNDTSAAFDELADEWTSDELGINVLRTPSYIGYDFGVKRTSFGQAILGESNTQHITSLRISQGNAVNRVLQVRVERSTGNFIVNSANISIGTNTGNGEFNNFIQGTNSRPGAFMLFASSSSTFTVAYNSNTISILGEATVGKQFDSKEGSFKIIQGTIPFASGDSFMVPVTLDWKRVDVINLPNTSNPSLIRIKQSAPARYWRIVPLSFAGASTTDEPWVIQKLEFFDFEITRLDDIQDTFFMENRDRDYAKTSVQLRVQYTPFDTVSDLSKFGFQIADIYSFTISFAEMVRALGRPIVTGDILELPNEIQYDINLRPVRKFLEVTDTGWAADGYTTSWKPIIYRFQAQQLIPGQEHRDILGTIDTQKYVIDDGQFFNGIEQIQTSPLTVTEKNIEEAKTASPEKGANPLEIASGANRFQVPNSYDGTDLYIQDGLPPDGGSYISGFTLPDVAGQLDGAYFRLEYPPNLNIPARLYRFSLLKNKFIYVETDKRGRRSAHKPSQLEILNLENTTSLTTKKF